MWPGPEHAASGALLGRERVDWLGAGRRRAWFVMFDTLDDVAVCVQRAWRGVMARREGREMRRRLAEEAERSRDVIGEEERRRELAIVVRMQARFRCLPPPLPAPPTPIFSARNAWRRFPCFWYTSLELLYIAAALDTCLSSCAGHGTHGGWCGASSARGAASRASSGHRLPPRRPPRIPAPPCRPPRIPAAVPCHGTLGRSPKGPAADHRPSLPVAFACAFAGRRRRYATRRGPCAADRRAGPAR